MTLVLSRQDLDDDQVRKDMVFDLDRALQGDVDAKAAWFGRWGETLRLQLMEPTSAWEIDDLRDELRETEKARDAAGVISEDDEARLAEELTGLKSDIERGASREDLLAGWADLHKLFEALPRAAA